MSDKNDTLVDKDGVVHEKGWDGQYHPKRGLFGPEKEQTWTGQANTERDWVGQPKKKTGSFGQQIRSTGGNILYRRARSGSGSGNDAFVILLVIIFVYVMIIGFVLALSGVIVAVTPLIAPAVLIFAEKERTKGNLVAYKKWNNWGIVASIVAVFVVIFIAGVVGISLYSAVISMIQNVISGSISPIITTLMQVFAAVIGFGCVILSFITGMAPTAIVYLHHKEIQLQKSGNSSTVDRIKHLKWGAGIVALVTICLAISSYITIMIIRFI